MQIRQLVRLSVVLTIGVGVQLVRGQGCVGSGAPEYMCPDPQGSLEVYVQHEAFCNRFYKCIEGKPVEGRCPAGSFFNPVESLCCPDESLCFRPQPCVAPIPGCQGCINKLVPAGVDPSEFFVCNCDGTGEGRKCPSAFDACTRTNVTLIFVNGRCQNPGGAGASGTTGAPGASTVGPDSLTTVASSSTTDAGSTTTVQPTTTTVAGDVTSTTVVGESTTVAGGSTTVAGESTTVAGESTTVAGGSTTVAGESTTVAGESTTDAGGSTTAADGSTTAAGETTTASGASTTTVAGSTTAAPAMQKK